MKRIVFCLLVGCLCVAPGCGEKAVKLTPEQIKQLCNEGGQASALAWVAITKPDPDEIKDVKFVLDEITKAMTAYQGQGFIGMLPQIDEAIKAIIPGTDEQSVAKRKLAHLLAQNALTGLDNLFAKHPDWETTGAQAALYVAAFTGGASDALDDFVVKTKAARAAAKK